MGREEKQITSGLLLNSFSFLLLLLSLTFLLLDGWHSSVVDTISRLLVDYFHTWTNRTNLALEIVLEMRVNAGRIKAAGVKPLKKLNPPS